MVFKIVLRIGVINVLGRGVGMGNALTDNYTFLVRN